jgi:hypothetical protein
MDRDDFKKGAGAASTLLARAGDCCAIASEREPSVNVRKAKKGWRQLKYSENRGLSGGVIDRDGGFKIPWEPMEWIVFDLTLMTHQRTEILKGVGPAGLAGLDQAHEQIPDPGAVLRFVKQGVLSS